MADLHNILSKFNELGIENKGLVPDDPIAQAAAPKQSSSNDQLDASAHARMVAESINGKHIPGVSDTSATDFAALAGVKSTTPVAPTPYPDAQRTVEPTPRPVSNTQFDDVSSIERRLDNIERSLSSIFESLQHLTNNNVSVPTPKKPVKTSTKESIEDDLSKSFLKFLNEVERGE